MAKMRSTSSSSSTPAESQVRMGFGEHLEEFRKRIILALIGAIVPILLCLWKMNDIVALLLRPYVLALKVHGYPHQFGTSKPPEVLLTYLGIGIKAGLVIASPWVIYQMWQFIAAGLYPKERKAVYKYVGPSAFLFLLGVAFFYFIVLPLTLNFFVGFTDNTAREDPQPTAVERFMLGLNTSSSDADVSKLPKGDDAHLVPIPMVSSDPSPPPKGMAYFYYNAPQGLLKMMEGNRTWDLLVAKHGSQFLNQPQLDDYLSFVTFTTLIFGAAFELPMIILVLAQLSLVEVKTFRKIRGYAYLGISIISAVAAPSGDVMSMMSLMVPLILLYEAGIVAAAISMRKRAKVEAARESAEEEV